MRVKARWIRGALWLVGFGCLWINAWDDPPLASGGHVLAIGTDMATVGLITASRVVVTATLRDAAGAIVATRTDEVARRASLRIPRDAGFLVVPPGTIREADEVAAAARAVIDELGHDRLVRDFNPRNDTMSREFLPPDARDIDSPYMRFALSDEVVGAVTEYVGIVPILFSFDAWYSPPPAAAEDGPRRAQHWHCDQEDVTQMKVWVHCNDIGERSGPL